MIVICRLLETGTMDGVKEAIMTCLARYSLCEHLLLNNINALMKIEGAKPIERLRVDSIFEDVSEKIQKATRGSGSVDLESLRRIDVGKKTLAVITAALYATLGQLGVDCGGA